MLVPYKNGEDNNLNGLKPVRVSSIKVSEFVSEFLNLNLLKVEITLLFIKTLFVLIGLSLLFLGAYVTSAVCPLDIVFVLNKSFKDAIYIIFL
jgi:hypothetical protein